MSGRHLRPVKPAPAPAKRDRLPAGAHVDHPKYQHGIVVEASVGTEPEIVVVAFVSGRRSELLAEYARLELVECTCDPLEWPPPVPRPALDLDASSLFDGPGAS